MNCCLLILVKCGTLVPDTIFSDDATGSVIYWPENKINPFQET